ncbi:uncharacterized protein LOC123320556 [Coccinella septempunctata]|uniref:uncharacterized protein LOC123320556 n=1 Tax=Coccinella septempunctata TaxID=41139 RepID=UPI001D098899|nr:uncharacterized protein LOC123320556 [Coccinella septempunctata]
MKHRGLEIAPQKTELLVVKGPRNLGGFYARFAGVRIEPTKVIKYLGVKMSKGPFLANYLEYITEKAAMKADTMGRLLPNIGGPLYFRRRVLSATVHSVLTYAAPVWRDELKKGKYMKKIISAQRRCLSVPHGPAEAVQVVAGFPPADLMVAEACFLFKIGSRLQGHRAMAPEEMETKFLTGHGSFGTYTSRIGKTATDECHVCGTQESPQHVFYEYARFSQERAALERDIGHLPELDGIIPFMGYFFQELRMM